MLRMVVVDYDFGGLGDQELEVYYVYYHARKGDRETPDEPAVVEIKSVHLKSLEISEMLTKKAQGDIKELILGYHESF